MIFIRIFLSWRCSAIAVSLIDPQFEFSDPNCLSERATANKRTSSVLRKSEWRRPQIINDVVSRFARQALVGIGPGMSPSVAMLTSMEAYYYVKLAARLKV